MQETLRLILIGSALLAPKTRSSYALAIFAVALLGGCAIFSFREVSLSYQELGERFSKRFPVERNLAGFLTVNLMRPRVAPRITNGEASRLAVTVDLEVKLPSMQNATHRTLWGSLTLSGIPSYDPASRSLHVVDAKLDRVRVDNMPDALSDALAKTATQLAKEYFEGKSLYVLSRDQLDRLRLRDEGTRLAFTIEADRLLISRR